MPSCVINFCKNNSLANNKASGITFHKFPKELDWKQKWIDAIRLSRNDETWLPSKFSVVCSTHFVEKDLYITKNGLRRVVKDAVPKKINYLSKTNRCIYLTSTDNTNMPTSNIPVKVEIDVEDVKDVKNAEDMEDKDDMEDIEEIFDTPVESKLRKRIKKYQKQEDTMKKKIKVLQQKIRRLNKSNVTLRNIIKKLIN